jgi:hypothetical protein
MAGLSFLANSAPNPKAEGRSPKEGRNPKSETGHSENQRQKDGARKIEEELIAERPGQ